MTIFGFAKCWARRRYWQMRICCHQQIRSHFLHLYYSYTGCCYPLLRTVLLNQPLASSLCFFFSFSQFIFVMCPPISQLRFLFLFRLSERRHFLIILLWLVLAMGLYLFFTPYFLRARDCFSLKTETDLIFCWCRLLVLGLENQLKSELPITNYHCLHTHSSYFSTLCLSCSYQDYCSIYSRPERIHFSSPKKSL